LLPLRPRFGLERFRDERERFFATPFSDVIAFAVKSKLLSVDLYQGESIFFSRISARRRNQGCPVECMRLIMTPCRQEEELKEREKNALIEYR